jgi:hypothetical protein
VNKTILHLTILIIAFLACRNDSAHKEFYGTYIRSVDSGLLYSKFIIYPENKYNFYSSSCFYSNEDRGSFVHKEDTLYFTSFDTKRDEEIKKTKDKNNRTLTGEKFVLKYNKLIYFRTEISHTSNPYIKPIIYRDTLYWIRDSKKQ